MTVARVRELITEALADYTPSGGGGIFDGARLPGAPVAMRIGWAQTLPFIEAEFIRANNHPLDGVAVGVTEGGLNTPPFPPDWLVTRRCISVCGLRRRR